MRVAVAHEWLTNWAGSERVARELVTVGEADELVASNDHFELYWFPHTDRLLSKRNNRTADPAEPLGRFKGWLDDEFLSNRAFGWANRLMLSLGEPRPPAG